MAHSCSQVFYILGKINTKQVKENISGSDEDQKKIKQDNMVGWIGWESCNDRYNRWEGISREADIWQGPTVQNKLAYEDHVEVIKAKGTSYAVLEVGVRQNMQWDRRNCRKRDRGSNCKELQSHNQYLCRTIKRMWFQWGITQFIFVTSLLTLLSREQIVVSKNGGREAAGSFQAALRMTYKSGDGEKEL